MRDLFDVFPPGEKRSAKRNVIREQTDSFTVAQDNFLDIVGKIVLGMELLNSKFDKLLAWWQELERRQNVELEREVLTKLKDALEGSR